LYLKPSQL